MERKEKQPILGVFQHKPRFLNNGGGSCPHMRINFFFKLIIWNFNIFFFMPKTIKQKKFNLKEKKWGAEIWGRSDFWKMGLICNFLTYEVILANDSSKCSYLEILKTYIKRIGLVVVNDIFTSRLTFDISITYLNYLQIILFSQTWMLNI